MDFYFGIDLLQRLRQYYESRLAQALSKGFDQPGAQYYWLFQELAHRASTLRRSMAMLDVLPEFMCRQTEDQIFAMAVGHTTGWFSESTLGTLPRDGGDNCIYVEDSNP